MPTAQAAADHLTAGMRCLHSGLFTGTYSGPLSGRVYVLVHPVSGQIKLAAAGTTKDFGTSTPVSVDGQRLFMAEALDASGDNFEGALDTYDEISGVWTMGTDTGTFTASRRLPDLSAAYRYTGEWYQTAVSQRLFGVQMFNVGADGNFVGTGPTVEGADYDSEGSIVGDAITMRVPSSMLTLTGTVDENLRAELTGVNNNQENLISFADGCKLN